ncbi:AAA family ATPase [bacterium]|nr:AAA family ATPase [bacterium]
MFVGRQTELDLLEEHYKSKTSEFCILYGRRRIGKSTLLEKFTENKPAFFFLAGRETKRQQLKRFVRELGEAVSDPLTGKTIVSEWDEALMLLDRTLPLLLQKSDTKKAIVVFDEFQWMCRGAVELLSDLQRHWDKKWKDAKNLMLILCGSSISFMLGDVLSRKSPLFGRRTFSFELNPFKVKEAATLLRFKGKFEVVESYLAVGGVPKYLEIMNTKGSFQQSITKQAFTASGYFFEEIRFLLAEQLRETEHYYMVLSQLAKGSMGVTELEKSTGIGSGQIMYYLERLNLLGFVSRHIPIGKSVNTKKVQYCLDDYYLRFYFTFVHPDLHRISTTPAGIGFDSLTGNRWSAFSGLSFEHFVRDHAVTVVSKVGFEGGIKRLGRFWQTATKRKRGLQIDLIIECDDQITLICECKWSGKKTGMDAVFDLRKRMDLYPNIQNHTLKPVIIAAGGVTGNVLNEKDISIVTLDDFFM